LNAIKNVGHNIAKVIVKERKQNGLYKNMEDFLNRIKDKDLNKKSLESLIKSGAFDRFLSRGQALGNLNTILEYNKKIQNDHKSGQNNLFADLPLASTAFSLRLDDFDDAPDDKKLSWEKELLGLYISNHPFKEYLEILKPQITTLDKLKNKEGQNVTVAGIITNVHKIITHKGQAMLFVLVEDSRGATEMLVFPKTLENTFGLWQDENRIMIRGKVSEKDGQPKVLVESAELINEDTINSIKAKNLSNKKLWIVLPNHFAKEKMAELKNILESSKGLTPVYLEINNGKTRKVKTDLKVRPDDKLKQKITEFLGQSAWLLTEK
ncbi:hypothetical protein C0580_05090, partial [Candidatus Parcubacteria bacterium]